VVPEEYSASAARAPHLPELADTCLAPQKEDVDMAKAE
jgi:hypothetical protein